MEQYKFTGGRTIANMCIEIYKAKYGDTEVDYSDYESVYRPLTEVNNKEFLNSIYGAVKMEETKQEYEFKVGDVGKTRDGREYRVICIDRNDPRFPILALLNVNGKEEIRTYLQNGQFHDYFESHKADLIPPKREIERWVNVYPDNKIGATYHSKDDAEKLAMSHVIATIKLTGEYSK